MPDALLTSAPGAKAAKICGILAVVLALTCVGIPVAIVLGIVAIVQQGKAKRLAQAQPEVYEPVPATGLVTGIIGLVMAVLLVPVVGIVSAIAIPAFVTQRDRARSAVVEANLRAAVAQAEHAVFEMQAKAPGQVASQETVIRSLSADPAILTLHNPFTSTAPAFQLGKSGPLGTVMVYADQEVVGGVTTWSIQFRAQVRRLGMEETLHGEVITRTQEPVPSHLVDGSQVVPPPSDMPVEPPVQAPGQPPAQAPPQQP